MRFSAFALPWRLCLLIGKRANDIGVGGDCVLPSASSSRRGTFKSRLCTSPMTILAFPVRTCVRTFRAARCTRIITLYSSIAVHKCEAFFFLSVLTTVLALLTASRIVALCDLPNVALKLLIAALITILAHGVAVLHNVVVAVLSGWNFAHRLCRGGEGQKCAAHRSDSQYNN